MLRNPKASQAVLIYLTVALSALIPLAACSNAEPVKLVQPNPKPQDNATLTTQPPVDTTTPTIVSNSAGEGSSWKGLVTFSGKESGTTPPMFIPGNKWRVNWAIESGAPQYASFNVFVRKEATGFIAGSGGYHAGQAYQGSITIDGPPDSYYIQVIAANLDKWSVSAGYDGGYAPGSPVQIALVHFQGTLNPLGCCNPSLYEVDEYVAIKNFSNASQDIRGWTLKNITRGYPSFTFPEYFPCIPFIIEDPEDYIAYTPPSVTRRFTTLEQAEAAETITAPVKIDWASCDPLVPLDEKPMKPVATDQGLALPCVLYPGQTVLVFTDEIHCFYGGFSFKYGQGNIWDNSKPDIAALYDSQGREMSRRSYAVD